MGKYPRIIAYALRQWRGLLGIATLSCAAAGAPLLGASAYFFGRRLKRATKANREAQSRLTSFVHTTIGAIPLVQAFGAEGRNVERYRALAGDAVRSGRRGLVLKQAYGVVNAAAVTIGTAVVLYAGGRRVLEGALSLGSLLVFLAYLRTIQGATQGLLGVYGNLRSAEASVDRVTEVLEVEMGVREAPDAKALVMSGEAAVRNREATAAGPRAGGCTVTWEGASFGYDDGKPVLHDVSLEVGAGKMLAVVGPTGADKSTLVSLVPRFFDPWGGRVMIDGQDLRQVRLRDVRAAVSIVLQEPFLLPLTVGLAIARAILKDAPVLILDEPTASLDAATEAAVMARLSTVRRADAVAVLEHGRLIQHGTHEELMRLDGLYRTPTQLQGLTPAATIA